MDSIRVKKDDVYRIEVNDDGEYIEFDLLDIDLGSKCLTAAQELEKEKALYNKQSEELYNQYKDDSKTLLIKQHDLDVEHCTKLRKAFDLFLGEGACKKIFGDTNRIGMFDALFEELSPHLEKMEINIKKIKQKIKEKYTQKDEGII